MALVKFPKKRAPSGNAQQIFEIFWTTFHQESHINPWCWYWWKVSRYTSHFYCDTFAKVCPPLGRKLGYTPPICIAIRLPFVSRYFCKSISPDLLFLAVLAFLAFFLSRKSLLFEHFLLLFQKFRGSPASTNPCCFCGVFLILSKMARKRRSGRVRGRWNTPPHFPSFYLGPEWHTVVRQAAVQLQPPF